MKGKNLLILCIVALVLAGTAVLTSRRSERQTAASSRIGQPVLPALQDANTLNRIQRVSFTGPDGTVNVARVEGTWVAPDKYGYPVDFGKVSDFVRKLADLKVGQTVVAEGDHARRMELVPPGEGAGQGTLVTCLDDAGETVAALLLGKEHQRAPGPDGAPMGGGQFGGGGGGYPDGRYVSADGEACLVWETLSSLPADAKAWFDDDLVSVYASDIVELGTSDTNGNPVVLKRPESGGDLALGDLSDDEEMDSSKVSGLTGMFSYLTFSDVADPALSDEDTGMADPIVCTARAKDGKVYTLRLGSSPEGASDRYARVSAEFLAPEPEQPEEPAPDEDEEAAKKREEEAAKRKEEHEKLAREVRELNDRLGSWTYLVSSYKVDDVPVGRADLVKEKEKPEEDEPVADAADEEPGESEPAAGEPDETEPAAEDTGAADTPPPPAKHTVEVVGEPAGGGEASEQ